MGEMNMSKIAAEMQQISDCVERYFQGMYQSDGEILRSAFHASAAITGNTEGKYAAMDVDGFVAFAEKQPSAAAAGEPYDMRIVTMDISDDAAMVKVADRYLGRDFIDYLSLLKVDDAWLIHNKILHGGPKS
jgi:hypothetical protein